MNPVTGTVDNVLAKQFPWCVEWEGDLRDLFAGYTEAKEKQNVVDYDDLLLYWAEMMADSNLAMEVGERFDHVLVDDIRTLIGFNPRS